MTTTASPEGVFHARRDRDLMAEIARQRDIAVARIAHCPAGGDDAGRVAAAVVHDDDLVRDFAQAQFEVQVLHRRRDAAFLIARRQHDRQQAQRFLGDAHGRMI